MCTNKVLTRKNRNVREKVDTKRVEKLVRFEEANQSFDKSSSSSLSWGEDCEQDATERVKQEYERMHRVLKGLEPIPPNYDKDEYKLWIKTFPSLRSPLQINANNRKRSYPTTPLSSRISYNRPVQPVIDEFITKLCNKLTNSKSRRPPERRERGKTAENTAETLERDFRGLLRISPAPILTKSVSVGTRNRLTSMGDDEEFPSLPFLAPKIEVKEASSKRKRRKSKNVVLPPIEMSLNQFRSVSAVPLQQGKCLSALSSDANLNFQLTNSDRSNLSGKASGLNRLTFN